MQDRGRQDTGKRNCGGGENHSSSSSSSRGARREIAMGSEEGPSIPRDKREKARCLSASLPILLSVSNVRGQEGIALLPLVLRCSSLLHSIYSGLLYSGLLYSGLYCISTSLSLPPLPIYLSRANRPTPRTRTFLRVPAFRAGSRDKRSPPQRGRGCTVYVYMCVCVYVFICVYMCACVCDCVYVLLLPALVCTERPGTAGIAGIATSPTGIAPEAGSRILGHPRPSPRPRQRCPFRQRQPRR